jgi:hypothetical protein
MAETGWLWRSYAERHDHEHRNEEERADLPDLFFTPASAAMRCG